jgi:putative DNA primase/helicase
MVAAPQSNSITSPPALQAVVSPADLVGNATDSQFAEFLMSSYSQTVRYIVDQQRWTLWDGSRWAHDRDKQIRKVAAAGAAEIRRYAGTVMDKERAKAAQAAGRWCESKRNMDNALALAAIDSRVETLAAGFDSDSMLLNCANGTLDLRTGALLSHDPRYQCSKITPIAYYPSATCPLWGGFLARTFRSEPEMVAYVRRAVGYSLTGSTAEGAMFFLHGIGSNGKSTFVETVAAVLGEYSQAAEAETWLRQSGSRVPEDLARIAGARMVTTAEITEGRALDEGRIKAVVTGDTITARHLFKGSFDFQSVAKMWISTNHVPSIKSTDNGIWRRIRLLPFSETISGDEIDRSLAQKLLAELPGILAWAVRGCLEWQRGGLQTPACVADATTQYRKEEDVIGNWIDDCCNLVPGRPEHASRLFRSYVAWAERAGHRPLNQQMFGRRLTERGLKPEKIGGQVSRIGIVLGPPDATQSF